MSVLVIVAIILVILIVIIAVYVFTRPKTTPTVDKPVDDKPVVIVDQQPDVGTNTTTTPPKPDVGTNTTTTPPKPDVGTNTTTTPPKPDFIPTIAWQGNNPNNVGGLVWYAMGTQPWNKYYKFSCTKLGLENMNGAVIGPVSFGNYKFPVIYLGEAPCPGFKVKIYRSNNPSGPYTAMDMRLLDNSGPYDGTRRYFIDMNDDGTPMSSDAPILSVAWQGNNPNNVGGLAWITIGTQPWNKYYKFSCIDNGKESSLTDAYGPVSFGNYKYPVIYLADSPCTGKKVKIYRSNSLSGPYVAMDMRLFDDSGPYYGNRRYFLDKND